MGLVFCIQKQALSLFRILIPVESLWVLFLGRREGVEGKELCMLICLFPNHHSFLLHSVRFPTDVTKQGLPITQAGSAVPWPLGQPLSLALAVSTTWISENEESVVCFAISLWKLSWRGTGRQLGRPRPSCVTSVSHHPRSPPRVAWTVARATAMSASKFTTRGVQWKLSTSTWVQLPTSGPR